MFYGSREKAKVLPTAVLQAYDLLFAQGFKKGNCWSLHNENKAYWLWETEDCAFLPAVLEWRENLRRQDICQFLPLLKTKKGQNYVKMAQRVYYLTEQVHGTPFVPEGNKFWEIVVALAKLHNGQQNLGAKQGVLGEGCLKAYQTKLTELLSFYYYLSEKRGLNNFEQLYVESFENFYSRGQEAIQKMALVCCSSENNGVPGFLIGNFRPSNLWETAQGIIFLETLCTWQGSGVQDLTAFLKMYLPWVQWDVTLAKKCVAYYQEKVGLSKQEKLLFLAQFSFPGHYCLYVEQYLHKLAKSEVLYSGLQNYLSQTKEQRRCFTALEKWLLA